MSIAQWAPGDGPRDKLLERGAQALSDAELLAIMLHTGYRGCSAIGVARKLLNQFGGLCGVIAADRQQLTTCSGVGAAKYAQLRAALELA